MRDNLVFMIPLILADFMTLDSAQSARAATVDAGRMEIPFDDFLNDRTNPKTIMPLTDGPLASSLKAYGEHCARWLRYPFGVARTHLDHVEDHLFDRVDRMLS